MRKSKLIFACAVSAFTLLLGACGQGSSTTSTSSATSTASKSTHVHDYKTEWSSDDTNHWHDCKDSTCTEKSGLAAHTAGDWIVDKEATYDVKGSRHKECTVCKRVLQTEEIAKKTHNYATTWSSDATKHWHACTDQGFTDLKKDEGNHTFGQWTTKTAAGQDTPGVKERTCTVCGYKETDSIPAKRIWIEAEQAELYIKDTFPPLSCSLYYGYSTKDEELHGGASLKNFSVVDSTVTVKVNASEAGEVNFYLAVCKRPADVKFEDYYALTVNGTNVTIQHTIPKGDESYYFNPYQIESKLTLVKGVNTIVCKLIKTNAPNLDAFGFESDTITLSDAGTVKSITHIGEGPYVKVTPTLTETGLWNKGCKHCGHGADDEDHVLPALNSTDYTVKDNKYTYKIDGNNSFTFEKLNGYVFECEDMGIAGIVPSGTNKDKPCSPEFCVANKDTASGGKAVNNINKAGNSLTLTFNSSAAAKATLAVRVAARMNSNKGYDVGFHEMYEVKLNDNVVETNMRIIPVAGNNKTLKDYYEWHYVELGEISLKQGANTLILTVPEAAKAGNIDYVKLFTTATLTSVK